MDTNEHRDKAFDETACAEAAAWIVKLHGPQRTPNLEAAFRAWLGASPENAREFERVTEVWDAGAAPVPGVPRLARSQFNSAGRRSGRWMLAAAAVLVIVGAGGWSADHFWLNPSYTTGIGEQRVLRLADGSRVTLNSASRVTVSYRQSERRVSLDRGEAFFEVAKVPERPFRVLAGVKQVEALGTSFDVRRDPEQVIVTLMEGQVAVSQTGRPVASLKKGQRVRLADEHAAVQVDEVSVDALTAWRRGEMMLDGTPLADAVAEMNRYDQRMLVIDDPDISNVRISGVYHTGDSELFATLVAKLYGWRVEHQDGRIHLTRRAP